jgi:hypothetical protein
VQVQNPITPSEMITVYNLKPTKLGQSSLLDKNSDVNKQWYNGVDFGFTARVGGGNVYGGASIGRDMQTICEVTDPNSLRFCDLTQFDIPYLTQFKLSGLYPLPLGLQLSGTWQGYPGVQGGTARQERGNKSLDVNYIVDRTVVPTLTVTSVTIPLIAPGTKFLDRWNQIDARLSKKFQIQRLRLQAQLDIFNILNSGSILSVVETYGTSLDRPTAILQGRLLAIGAQLSF